MKTYKSVRMYGISPNHRSVFEIRRKQVLDFIKSNDRCYKWKIVENFRDTHVKSVELAITSLLGAGFVSSVYDIIDGHRVVRYVANETR